MSRTVPLPGNAALLVGLPKLVGGRSCTDCCCALLVCCRSIPSTATVRGVPSNGLFGLHTLQKSLLIPNRVCQENPSVVFNYGKPISGVLSCWCISWDCLKAVKNAFSKTVVFYSLLVFAERRTAQRLAAFERRHHQGQAQARHGWLRAHSGGIRAVRETRWLPRVYGDDSAFDNMTFDSFEYFDIVNTCAFL